VIRYKVMDKEYENYPWKNSMIFCQWPKDRVLPTIDEFKKAEEVYLKEVEENDKKLAAEGKVDWSDGSCSFCYLMATYSRFVWWKFFFQMNN